MKRIAILTVLAVSASLAMMSSSALAGGVHVGIGIGIPVGGPIYHPYPYYPYGYYRPYYYGPPPVYVAPAPVYVQPTAVYQPVPQTYYYTQPQQPTATYAPVTNYAPTAPQSVNYQQTYAQPAGGAIYSQQQYIPPPLPAPPSDATPIASPSDGFR